MPDLNNYYTQVKNNPTATPEAKAEADKFFANQGGAPPTPNKDTSSLDGTLNKDTPAPSAVGDMSNLRVALRAALTEATQKKSASRIGALSPLLEGGAAPSVIGAAVGLAQQGLAETQDKMFSDIMTGVSEEQKRMDAAKKDTLTSINTMIDNGVFQDMPDSAVLTLEKQAGLPEGTVLAWKARLTAAKKQSDEKAAMELKLVQSQINENMAQTSKVNSENNGGGFGGASNIDDIIQKAVDAGATPEQAAREAGISYENMGIQVTPKLLDNWTARAKGLKKTVAPKAAADGTPAAPIFGTSPYSKNVSIDDRISHMQQQNQKMGFNKNIGIRDELVKEGYPAQEIYKRTQDVFDKIESSASSFFTNLFQ